MRCGANAQRSMGGKSTGSSGEGKMIKICSQQWRLTAYSGPGAMTKASLIAAKHYLVDGL